MNNKYFELRNKYKRFIYHGYKINETEESINIEYDFEIEGLSHFTPKWSFGITKYYNDNKNNKKYIELIDNLIFNLGMIELISYNKLTCSKTVVVKCGQLTKEIEQFYKKIYINGLGEFFFVNNIVEEMNIETFIEFESYGKKREYINLDITLIGNLIPVGGGKDSALTLEILRKNFSENTPYSINKREAVDFTIDKAGYNKTEVYAPIRTLDPKLIELNSKGFLNGHTPFSAIVAFSSMISVLITGKRNIVLSNESSADESNIPSTNINHQYSKSLEFENDFRNYIDKNIGKNIPNYFSLLRPLNEFQIVREFAKSPKYFSGFRSCNVGSKTDSWCLDCAKCLYVYIMLFAATNKDTVIQIFKEDLLEKENLYDIFMGLVNPDFNKPFECVGTKSEINLSVNIIIKKYEKENIKLPYLLKKYVEDTNLEYKSEEEYEYNKAETSNYWNEKNNLDEDFKLLLKSYINS